MRLFRRRLYFLISILGRTILNFAWSFDKSPNKYSPYVHLLVYQIYAVITRKLLNKKTTQKQNWFFLCAYKAISFNFNLLKLILIKEIGPFHIGQKGGFLVYWIELCLKVFFLFQSFLVVPVLKSNVFVPGTKIREFFKFKLINNRGL